jgi:KaiC/GvpD/RAD55 family RecA-like ATPase
MSRRPKSPPKMARTEEAPKVSHFSALNGLAKFLVSEGSTLLIKGSAGAGKTTLALQLLGQLAPNGGGVYLSSRVSEHKLQSELPWVEFGSINQKGSNGFSDLRLGSPAAFVEEILDTVAKDGRVAAPAVVLDTWDGIAKEMPESDRLKSEKMLIAVADRSKTRMIFVSEEPERTTMDYLVDGIVELRREEKSERIFREIEVQKLRGTRIDQHKYIFTLEGGRFTLIPPYSPPVFTEPRPVAPVRDHGEYFSFGSPMLDNVFQGLRKGGTFTLVYDENVPYSALRLIEVSALINALNTGKGVVTVPLPGAPSSEVAELAAPFVSPGVYRKCLAIGSLGSGSDLQPPLYSVSDKVQAETSADINKLVSRVRDNSETKSVLIVESIDTFEAPFASNIESVLEGVGGRSGSVRTSETDALLLLIQQDSPIRSRILSLSRRYARLFMKDRSVVILGEKPSTPAYAIDHDPKNPILARLSLIV